MKIQWLGTAASEGWPAVYCNCEACRKAAELGGRNIRMRAGAIIDDILLIDLNPDLYAQRLRFGLDLARIRDVIVTHEHGDHFTPLYVEFREPVYCGGPMPRLPLYGPSDVTMPLRKYGEEGLVELHTVEAGDEFDTSEHHVTTLQAVHSAPLGKFYLIEKGGKSILYMHDTGLGCDAALAMLRERVKKPIDLVSMDCTYGPNPLPEGYSGHMGFAENVRLKEMFLKDGLADGHTRFVSNHFSHNGHMLYDEMCRFMEPHGIEIAYDGMVAEV